VLHVSWAQIDKNWLPWSVKCVCCNLIENDSLPNLIVPIKNYSLIIAHWRTFVEHDMPISWLIIVKLTTIFDIFFIELFSDLLTDIEAEVVSTVATGIRPGMRKLHQDQSGFIILGFSFIISYWLNIYKNFQLKNATNLIVR
jgi:hypothetical protein